MAQPQQQRGTRIVALGQLASLLLHQASDFRAQARRQAERSEHTRYQREVVLVAEALRQALQFGRRRQDAAPLQQLRLQQQNAHATAPAVALHLNIDGRWQAQFMIKPAQGHEIRAESQGIRVLMDLATAQRAQGMRVDWVDDARGSGLTISLPLAPVGVRSLSVEELAARIRQGNITVLDVRPDRDRQIAAFPAARALDAQAVQEIGAMPKDTALAFLCHHGNSSRQAAEHFRGLGFTQVYNVDGGIDAWSQRVDASVPRY